MRDPPRPTSPQNWRANLTRSLGLIAGGVIASVLVWLYFHPVQSQVELDYESQWPGVRAAFRSDRHSFEAELHTLFPRLRSGSPQQLAILGFTARWYPYWSTGGLHYTSRRLWLTGPVWSLPLIVIVTIGTAVVAAWRLGSRLRRRSAGPPGRCRQCGYDLRATPARCPECGRACVIPVGRRPPRSAAGSDGQNGSRCGGRSSNMRRSPHSS